MTSQLLGKTALRAFFIVLLGAIVLSHSLSEVEAQAFDYCKESSKETLFFIDLTNGMKRESDKEVLLRGLTFIVARLEAGQKMRIVSITDSHARSQLLFSGCYPRCKHEDFFHHADHCNQILTVKVLLHDLQLWSNH